MKMKKSIWLFSLFLGMVLFGISQGWAQPKPGTHVPIITHSFAVERGYYGYIWKLYIEAEDPDGDMYRIAAVVDETGYGHYPTSWTMVKPQYRQHLSGYLQWNTFSSKGSYIDEWTQITLKVSIFDKAGNESNEVAFPFEFVSGVKNPYGYGLPAPFDKGDLPRLGHVNIDLYNPRSMGVSVGEARDN